jgi:hypothetical protein
VVRLAFLEATWTGEPICAPFAANVTVPVGFPPYSPVTVAVKVTCRFDNIAMALDFKAAVVVA